MFSKSLPLVLLASLALVQAAPAATPGVPEVITIKPPPLNPTPLAKTVFITITNVPKPPPAKTASSKPKPSSWSKGKHCPYPYPGERCSPPKTKSEHKSKPTKTSAAPPVQTLLSKPKPCPYPGQKC